jgi:hypothetical protein
LAATLGAGHAAADDNVYGTRSGERLVERQHQIAVTIDHGHATLVVRRTVHNGGPRHDQATFWLALPLTAVATNLRTLGTLNGQPHWFTADLLEAEAAAKRYKELTGIGGYYPKDPALLSWRHQGELALQVFPVAPGTDKTVEYTLEMPTHYTGGRDHLVLGRFGTSALRATATVSAREHGEAAFAAGKPIAGGATVKLDAEDGLDLSISRAGARPVGGAMAAIPMAKSRVLLRQRIEAAPRLGEIPRDARVVVILDASRSLTAEEAAGEVAAARAYLSHFESGEAEILTFDRAVTALHGGFVPVKKARATLDRVALTRKNGSRVDDALTRAAALFHGLPSRLPRRVVLFTDTRTRDALATPALRALVKKTGALVHVGVPGPLGAHVERDDEHAWASFTRATGGLVWRAGGTLEASRAADMRAAYEELARPLRVDRIKVTIPGLATDPFAYPESIPEGEGFADLRVVDKMIGFLRVDGEVWATPVSTTMLPNDDENRVAAALTFGSDALGELSEPEMMVLAKTGHAVSPVTSLLAIEPGVRPSTEGLEDGEIGDSFGVGGLGLSGIGEGGGGSAGPPDLMPRLEALLGAAWNKCGGAGQHASIDIETTYDEIVDVGAASTASASLGRCLEEAAWEVDLPDVFRYEAHRHFAVRL